MTRKSTWTNPDGLVVGFGPNFPERQESGVHDASGDDKVARLYVTYQSTFGASGAKIVVPDNSIVKNVYFKTKDAWTGGTSLTFGDTDPDGWLTAAQLAQAAMTADKSFQAAGAYAFTATEGQLTPKEYNTQTDLFITSVGTWTAGTGWFVVEYV